MIHREKQEYILGRRKGKSYAHGSQGGEQKGMLLVGKTERNVYKEGK